MFVVPAFSLEQITKRKEDKERVVYNFVGCIP
jgi:hypothetical protein